MNDSVDYDLVGWEAIGEAIGVCASTAKRYAGRGARGLPLSHPLPVVRVGRNVCASGGELAAWVEAVIR